MKIDLSRQIRAKIRQPSRIMAPVMWFGGKGLLAPKILPLIPRRQVYVEPFCGAASMLFHAPPYPVEIINDLNGDLVNLFRVLQDPKTFEEFAHRITWTPCSFAEFVRALEMETDDPVMRAWAFYVRINQGFSGRADGPGDWSRTFVCDSGMAATANRWRGRMKNLEWWHSRLTRVQIDNRDALDVIRYWDSVDTVFYVDPPYVAETRKSGGYEHECSDDFHARLVTLLLAVKGAVVLSGYAHPIYEPLEAAGWHRTDIRTACHAAGKIRISGMQGAGGALAKVPRVESVWVSPTGAMQGRLL